MYRQNSTLQQSKETRLSLFTVLGSPWLRCQHHLLTIRNNLVVESGPVSNFVIRVQRTTSEKDEDGRKNLGRSGTKLGQCGNGGCTNGRVLQNNAIVNEPDVSEIEEEEEKHQMSKM